MRRGFSLVTAIFMMTLIAVVGVAILSLSSYSTIQKSQAFMRAQAELLARSATEYAIYEIQRDASVLTGTKRIDRSIDQFDINITLNHSEASQDLNGTVLMDITVRSKDLEDTGLYPIRFSKKTVQQI